MRIAFCTTVKGRAHHLKQTLPKNLSDNAAYEDAVFVILDYGSNDDLAAYMASEHIHNLASGRVVYYRFPLAGSFHMAHAKNMAHRCGMLEGADILVNLDADGFTGEGFAEYIAEQFAATEEKIFFQALWNRWVDRENGSPLEWLAQDSTGEYGPPVPKGSNGRMVVTRDTFLLAGGYDEKFDTWGPDDKDFNIRIRRLGFTPRLLERRFLETILHNDKVRFREYPHAASVKGYEFHITVHDQPTNTIANSGRFGCGVVYRNFAPEPISLQPLPTRIFGLGMHKTATTSLHLALSALGFNSGHWTSAHWAKRIWQQMNNKGRSATLERNYALCDLPIPLLYRKLDAAYPGSKFILTLLDEEAWVKAAEVHWSIRNRYRPYWDSDPFTHRIHEVLYGQREFNREVFLDRYRHHNRDVLTYFARRPDDLLVMDMSAGAGWKELCGFLGKQVPAMAYPHANPSSDIWMG